MKFNLILTGFVASQLILILCLYSCNRNDLAKGAGAVNEKTLFDRHHGDSIFTREFGQIISLCGEWEIAEGPTDVPPRIFPSKIHVPGLVHLAEPAFAGVGEESTGKQVFWYRKKFTLEGRVPEMARLKIFKAMYGSRVFLNGRFVGENTLSFVPQYFSITGLLKGQGEENELIIGVGAHISVLPDTVVSGGDPERRRYPPGIYDRVEIILSNDPYISHVQVIPSPDKKEAGISFEMTSVSHGIENCRLRVVVYDYETGDEVSRLSIRVSVPPRGKKNYRFTIPIPDCQLWSPDKPELYILMITDDRYRYLTRFGMRSFRVDGRFTNRALLNDQPYFIRGTNFAIHRFFEDSLCSDLPWNREWVRKLIRKYTSMGMNGARFVISPAPEMWYDVADEEGLIVFDEYPIWYAYQPDVGDVSDQSVHPYRKWGIWPAGLTAERLAGEFTAWMRERWNHPSVCVWDAQNETWARQTGEAINQVRHLDLSNRPWDNGWSPPADSSDIREAHPYFEGFIAGTEMTVARHNKSRPFTLADIQAKERIPQTFYLPYQYAYHLPAPQWYWKQPCIINEYSYLWLKRNGEPTNLTKNYYDAMLGKDATPGERRELYARYLAAVTEYWRAARTCIGVLYPFGLAASLDECETSDNLTDVRGVDFDPAFLKYVPDAFSPVGVCAGLWQQEFTVRPWWGTTAEYPVTVINDTDTTYRNLFYIKVMKGDSVVSQEHYHYEVGPFATSTVHVRTDLPDKPGWYEVVAELHGRGDRPIRSYRKIHVIQ